MSFSLEQRTVILVIRYDRAAGPNSSVSDNTFDRRSGSERRAAASAWSEHSHQVPSHCCHGRAARALVLGQWTTASADVSGRLTTRWFYASLSSAAGMYKAIAETSASP